MADKERPPVAGKGPAFMRETIATLNEVAGEVSGLPAESAEKIKTFAESKVAEVQPLLSRAYMKTVKAGEVCYDCKVMAEELKQNIAAGNEAQAVEGLGSLEKEMDALIHKVKTFVVRMT